MSGVGGSTFLKWQRLSPPLPGGLNLKWPIRGGCRAALCLFSPPCPPFLSKAFGFAKGSPETSGYLFPLRSCGVRCQRTESQLLLSRDLEIP